MKLTINRDARTASLTGRWAAHEATAVTLAGLTGADTGSLRLALYSTAGVVLALCADWTAEMAGTLDTRTAAVATLFEGRRPDESMVVIMALADKAALYVLQAADMVNNPLAAAPMAPDPAPRFLVAADFAALAPVAGSASGDAIISAVNQILAALKEPDQ